MKKKRIVCGVVASALALSVTLGGCSSLVSANTAADMKQTIATVNISKAEDFEKEGLTDYKDAVGTTSVSKRELISAFLNVGYSYVNSGYYSYEDVFKMLVDQLVQSAVITQYSVMYLLKDKAEKEGKSATEIMEKYNEQTTLAAKYEYVLGGKDNIEVKLAEYSLRVAVNTAIDSYEENILEDEDDDNSGSGSRALPGGVDTEQDKFYPRKTNDKGEYLDDNDNVTDDKDKAAIDYNIYTGYEGYELTNSGAYKDDALDGTKESTRKRAYNSFLSSVNSYNLIDVKKENMKDARNLQYIEDEYINQLEQRIKQKYYETYEEKLEDLLKDKGSDELYKYIQDQYDISLRYQKDNYNADSFTSTIDSMSDSSFILYVPETDSHGVYTPESGKSKFGLVYNILLPFNAYQSTKLTEYQTLYKDDDEDSGYSMSYFVKRNELLRDIKTTDQREAWFNGTTDYSFNASEKGDIKYYKTTTSGSDWLFFEKNLLESDKYEELDKYAGLYPYNGTVVKKDEGYLLIPNELTIDAMLEEFSAYVNFVLESSGNVQYSKTPNYYDTTDFYTAEHAKDKKNTKLDYSKFVYASGKVNNLEETLSALYDKTSKQYKAMSAVNELQYAYTTDTGVLSNYAGYSVNAGDTNYIKEFEYASQMAINKEGLGVGGFAVCAGDYGWHLIYVTAVFESDSLPFGETPDWTKIENDEDSFEKFFYEWVKNKDIVNISNKRETEILTQFNIDKTVKKYQKAYQDLLNLG